MKTILLSVFAIIYSTQVVSQEIKRRHNGQLTTSVENIIGGFINGEVCIDDIYFPDNEFNCLKPLGQPVETIESYTIASDDITFIYNGLKIFYSNVSGQMKLSSVEFTSGESFLLLKNREEVFSTSKKIQDQLIFSKLDESDLGNSENLTLKFYDDEGSSMTFERKNGVITKIKIYFL